MLRILYTGHEEGPKSMTKDTHIHSFIAGASAALLNFIASKPIKHSQVVNISPSDPTLRSIRQVQIS